MDRPRLSTRRALALLVALGAALRIALLLVVEHQLEVSEAIVGLMALDILEGKALPFFFYGTAYNGGGALEAYLAAASFAVAGPGAIAVKLWIPLLWLAAAGLLADVCQRNQSRAAAILTLAFFSLGTPFLLEWSLKARGGFIETVLFSTLLLWLAAPPKWLRARSALRGAGFGLALGVGLWCSEMLLAMVPCAGLWLFSRLEARERGRAALAGAFGAGVGLLPLLLYNLANDWAHVRASVLLRVLQPGEGEALALAQLESSLAFVLGWSWPLLCIVFAIGAVRLLRDRSRLQLGHVALAHVLIYGLAYAFSGERYLEVPPSRVLFALHPSLAILFGQALAPPRKPAPVQGYVAVAVATWAVAVCGELNPWIGSGRPREAGSWRGSWALVDGEALRRELLALDVGQVYASRWTVPPLVFAQRVALADGAGDRKLGVTSLLPDRAPTDRERAALVLLRDGPLAAYVAELLEARGIPHRTAEWDRFAIFHAIPSDRLHRGIGLPAVIASEDWPPLPDAPDGFN
jgi:hypothetical protein